MVCVAFVELSEIPMVVAAGTAAPSGSTFFCIGF